jgi:GT2 family glycosyltransferase
VIPTRDRPASLVATLGYLLCQAVPASDWEVVVVDDGSKPSIDLGGVDKTGVCRLLRTEGNGRSRARNAGAEAARGEVLIFLDDDIFVRPGFLGAHLDAQRRWSGALATGAVCLPDSVQATPFGRFRQRLEAAGRPETPGLTSNALFGAANNMSMPRHLFRNLGGFDPDLSEGEDQDLAFRHSTGGGRIAFVPAALGVHTDAAVDLERYLQRVEVGAERLVKLCQRHPDWPDNQLRLLVNGRLRPGQEPIGLSVRKLLKVVLGVPPFHAAIVRAAHFLERQRPYGALLDRLYSLLIGVNLLRGFRHGLATTPEYQ